MGAIFSFFENALCILQNFIAAVLKSKKKKNKGFKPTSLPNVFCLQLTKNLSLLTKEKSKSVDGFRIDQREGKPLVVLVCWMSAKRKHTYKFAQIWMEKGFDVLTITISALDLIWPVLGSQLVAADVLKFLDENKSYSQIILHGFSVGGYQWAEVLVQMAQNLNRYQHILDKIVGQVWGSVADAGEVTEGLKLTVFPNNKLLANALHKYMVFHLKFFYKVATRHHVAASRLFHSNMVNAPVLLIISKKDPIGTVCSNQGFKESWESAGIKVHWKMFEDSAHVDHFRTYPQEYMAHLNMFLDSLNLTKPIQTHDNIETKLNKLKL